MTLPSPIVKSPSASFLQDHLWLCGFTKITQEKLITFNWIVTGKSHLLCKITYSQYLGIQIQTYLQGGHYSLLGSQINVQNLQNLYPNSNCICCKNGNDDSKVYLEMHRTQNSQTISKKNIAGRLVSPHFKTTKLQYSGQCRKDLRLQK